MDQSNLKDYFDRLSLSGARITEKRKYFQSILDELNQIEVRKALSADEGFIWQSVFDGAKSVADEEYKSSKKSIQRALDKPPSQQNQRRSTSGTTSNISTECFGFFKTIVGILAENYSSVQSFPAKEIVEFCFRALEDESDAIRSAYGKNVCQLLAKTVFCDPTRCTKIRTEQFEGVVDCILDQIQRGGSDAQQFVEILRISLASGVTKWELNSEIIDRLEQLLEQLLKSKPNKKSIESIIASVNAITETYGMDRRARMCEFGEKFGVRIFDYYEPFSVDHERTIRSVTNVDQYLQNEVSKFFCIQFALRHPNNANGQERGSLVTDSWMAIVTGDRGLYERLRNELAKVNIKYPDPKKLPSPLLATDALDLASRILIQTFVNTDRSQSSVDPVMAPDVVQESASLYSSNQHFQPPPRKRQRVEETVGWSSVLATINGDKISSRPIPWLEILEYAFATFPEKIPVDETYSILKELITMADTVKRSDILSRLLAVIRVIVTRKCHSYSKRADLDQMFVQLRSMLHRMVSSRSVQSHAAALLSVLLENGSSPSDNVDSQLIRVLGMPTTDVLPEILTWISSVLTECDFDEKLSMDTGTMAAKVRQPYSFRIAIIDWLVAAPRAFVDEYADGDQDGASSGIRALTHCLPSQVAEIVVLLICDKPAQATIRTKVGAINGKPNGYRAIDDFFTRALCLGAAPVDNRRVDSNGEKNFDDGVEYIPEMGDILAEKLIASSTALLNVLGTKDVISKLEYKSLVNHWCLLWCCTTFSTALFGTIVATSQKFRQTSSELFEIITKRSTSLEYKTIFVECIVASVRNLMKFKIELQANMAPQKLLDTILTLCESGFNALGSSDTDELLLLRNAILAFGSVLQYCCQAGDLTSTNIPDMCRDFLRSLRDSTADYSLITLALREISRFFASETKDDSEVARDVATLFLEIVKTIVNENRRDSARVSELLEILDAISSWAVSNETIRTDHLAILSMALSFKEDRGSESRVNPAIATSVLHGYDRYLKNGGSTDGIPIDSVLSALDGSSFRVSYTFGQVAVRIAKDLDGFEKVIKWYEASRKATDRHGGKSCLDRAFCVTICGFMRNGISFHVPCLVKLMAAAKENTLDRDLCKAALQSHFDDKTLRAVLETSLDAVLSYWLASYGMDFERFPFGLWNKENLDEFLRSVCTRLFPLASMVIDKAELSTFMSKLTPDDEEESIERLKCYSLASTIASGSEDSSAVAFWKIITNGTKEAAMEYFIGAIGVLCKWLVFERSPVPKTIEITEKVWDQVLKRLFHFVGASNLTEALVKLPERSIIRLVLLLRNHAVRSYAKCHWVNIVSLVAARLDFRQVDNSTAAFVVRESLSIVCEFVRDSESAERANVGLGKLTHLFALLHRQAGEAVAESVDIVLATTIFAARKFAKSENSAVETAQSIVQFVHESKLTLANSPLFPASWKNLRSMQYEAMKKSSIRSFINVLIRRPLWMISIDELVFVTEQLEKSKSRSFADNSRRYRLSLSRKLLAIVEKSPDRQLRHAALKLLSNLCKLNESCGLNAFFYPWNYEEPMEESLLQTLEECLKSESSQTVYLAAECLVKAIDTNPSIDVALREKNDLMLVLQAFLPKKEGAACLTSLSISRWDEKIDDNAEMSEFVLAIGNSCRDSSRFAEPMTELFVCETWTGERLLPYVVEYSIRRDESCCKDIANVVNRTLTEIVDGDRDLARHYSVVRCVLSCLKRLQHSGIKRSGMEVYRLLPIDYALLARAASVCGLPSMAPLMMEIGTESLRTVDSELRFDFNFTSESLFSDMAQGNPNIGMTLLQSYLAMKDSEGVESLGEFGAMDSAARILSCEIDGDMGKLVSLYCTIGNASEMAPWYLIPSAMNQNGGGTNGRPTDTSYSCAWKLCQWDSFARPKTNLASCSFNQLVFESLRNFEHSNVAKITSTIWDLNASNIKDRSVIPQFLINRLLLVDDLETASFAIKNGQGEENFERTRDWTNNFDDRLWSAHAVLDRVLNNKSMSQKLRTTWIAKQFTPITCDLLQLCRRRNLNHIGLKVVEKSRKALLDLFGTRSIEAESFITKLDLEEIELLWASGEDLRSSSLLKALAAKLEKSRSNNDPELLCSLTKCLVLLREFKLHGRNVGSSSTTTDDKVLEVANLLANAASLNPSLDVSTALGTAYLAIAQFANRQYQEITDYIKSPIFLAHKENIKRFRDEVRNVDTTMKTRSPLVETVDERTYKSFRIASQKKSDVDSTEVVEMCRRQLMHLTTALQSYMSVLGLCNDHDVLIFRVVSLWLDNTKSREAIQTVEKQLPCIKSYKWLPVFPQLASHLTTNPIESADSAHAAVIKNVVTYVALDHPFHTFYTLNSLATATPRDDVDLKRKTAADEILTQATRNQKYGQAFKCMKKLTDELILLNDFKPPIKPANEPPSKLLDLPPKYKGFAGFKEVPLPTMTIQPSPTSNYETVPRITSFDTQMTMMSGLSAPKRITCLCSDGVKRRFLLKGGDDDPRQDALMEQVFAILNIRLKRKERETGSIDGQYGSMRTYNVVPLAPKIGLIENCDGCISLGDYLLGPDNKSGARAVYYPKAPTAFKCRVRIHEAAKEDFPTRRRVFYDACKEIRPVFRHFFYERFPDANEWFERRRAYTISVAVSSMDKVGHIIGLSDRHVQNIMIDEKTGEVVHIDHGMAFEQGRLLPTPETVPFRLTRDMTNPMGICGLNGVFRRSCVRTLIVLKESRDILMPILSVLLQDPISQWTLTASKIEKKQPNKRSAAAILQAAAAAECKNVHAERAISRVSDKLNGREKTELLLVEGQVSHLIDLARDPSNLCVMYSGWQAFL